MKESDAKLSRTEVIKKNYKNDNKKMLIIRVNDKNNNNKVGSLWKRVVN